MANKIKVFVVKDQQAARTALKNCDIPNSVAVWQVPGKRMSELLHPKFRVTKVTILQVIDPFMGISFSDNLYWGQTVSVSMEGLLLAMQKDERFEIQSGEIN